MDHKLEYKLRFLKFTKERTHQKSSYCHCMDGETFSGFGVLGNISWGTHFCQFYEAKEDLLEILVPYIHAGLANNEYCLCILSQQGFVTPGELKTALAQFVPHLEQRLVNKDIEIVSESDWYFQDSKFDSASVLNALNEKYQQAVDRGYSGARVWGDTFWLNQQDWKDFNTYEKHVENLVNGSRMIVLCTYPVNRISAIEILDVVNAHRFAIARRKGNWEIIETATEGQSRARLVVDTIPTMAWTIRPDGVVDFVNKRWTEYTGYTVDILKDPLRVIHADDFSRVMNKWQANLGISRVLEDEVRLRRSDGEYRWFLVRTAPLIDEHGHTINWYGIATDIDDSKRLSNALQETEQRYLSLFENMREGVAYLRVFFDGEVFEDAIYLEVNPAWEVLTGMRNVIGRRMTEALPQGSVKSSNVIARACMVALTGRPESFEAFSNWLKKWLLVKAYSPMSGHVIIVLDDITERKEAEEKLKLAYKRLSDQVENTPLGVIEFDKDLNVKRWSKRAEQLFGWTALEVLGKNVNDPDFPLIYKEDLPAVDEINVELTKGTVDWNQSHNRNNTKDGNVVSCEWYNSVLRDEQGDVLTILCLVLDVTERNKTQAKLQHVNEELHSLSSHLQNIRELERAAVAREIHDELGQQLTGLRIDALWVAKKLETGEKAIKDKVADMVALINETMKAVRRISTQLRPGILDDLGLIAALEWQAQEFEKRTSISSHFKSSHYDMNLRKDLATNIFRIYQEALTNIARHANATKVETSIETTDGHIRLIINDNGQGFDQTQAKGGSFGMIGMKERALMMGGELTIDSVPQTGTVVTLVVPIKTTEREDQ
jgi:PAS domain S-box-containing protein